MDSALEWFLAMCKDENKTKDFRIHFKNDCFHQPKTWGIMLCTWSTFEHKQVPECNALEIKILFCTGQTN